MPPREKLSAFAMTGATLAIHLSIHVLESVVAELAPHYGLDCPIAIVYRASWADEQIVRSTLGTILAESALSRLERTALILVGPALTSANFRDSALYDPDYRRRFRDGSGSEQVQ